MAHSYFQASLLVRAQSLVRELSLQNMFPLDK